MKTRITKQSTRIRLLLFSICLLLFVFPTQAQQTNGHDLIQAVDAIGMTVSGMARALDFYTKVLTFEKVSDIEVAGDEYEHLFGVFGLRIRVARLKLGGEFIELTDYLAPEGRPIPVDMRSNETDTIVQRLRMSHAEFVSSAAVTIPEANLGFKNGFLVRDPDGHAMQIVEEGC